MFKLTPLAFLSLFFFVTVSVALPTDDVLVHALDKRNNKVCPCAFAVADFNGVNSAGPARGLVSFAQDETGSTTVAGIFSQGFEKEGAITFKLVDDCGVLLHDLSQGLN